MYIHVAANGFISFFFMAESGLIILNEIFSLGFFFFFFFFVEIAPSRRKTRLGTRGQDHDEAGYGALSLHLLIREPLFCFLLVEL